ncbi:MAG: hypothetical protein ACXVYB_16930 [Arthrobacter sp.]
MSAYEAETRVTWTMTGENKGIGRIFALFMNMDNMVGPDFDKGLTSLANTVAQRGACINYLRPAGCSARP